MFLQSHRYIQVSRCGKRFHGTPIYIYRWLYWCSCDQRRSSFIAALHVYIDNEIEAVSSEYPECQHITVVKELAEESIDGVYGIAPEYDLTGWSYLYL